MGTKGSLFGKLALDTSLLLLDTGLVLLKAIVMVMVMMLMFLFQDIGPGPPTSFTEVEKIQRQVIMSVSISQYTVFLSFKDDKFHLFVLLFPHYPLFPTMDTLFAQLNSLLIKERGTVFYFIQRFTLKCEWNCISNFVLGLSFININSVAFTVSLKPYHADKAS